MRQAGMSHADVRNELVQRVTSLRELITRREAQRCAEPIIEACREQLREAERNLRTYDEERRR